MIIAAMSTAADARKPPIEGPSVKRAALIIMAFMMLSRILGLFKNTAMAALFGQNIRTDAFWAAFSVPDLLYFLVSGGAMTAAFIPIFTDFIVAGREEEGRRVANSIWNSIALIVLAGIGLGELFAPRLVRLLPGIRDNPEGYAACVLFVRTLYPMVLFTALAGFLNGVLHSYRHFVAPAASWLIYNVCFIAFAFVSCETIGLRGVCIGALLGAVLMAAVQIPVAAARGMRWSPVLDWRHPAFVKYWKTFFPVMLGLALSQINLLIVPTYFGSMTGEGSITSLTYANRILFAPLGIFGSAISMAIFPTLARIAGAGEMEKLGKSLARGLRASFLMALPCSALFLTAGLPTVRLSVGLFGGEFDYEACRDTAWPLAFFGLGLIGHTSNQLLSRGFYAVKDVRAPLAAGLVGLAVTPAAALALIKTPLGHAGVALAISIGALVNLTWLLVRAAMKLHLRWTDIVPMFLKTAFASLVLAAVAYGAGKIYPIGPDRFDLQSVAAHFTIVLLPALSAFAAVLRALKVAEFDELLGTALGRFGRKPARR